MTRALRAILGHVGLQAEHAERSFTAQAAECGAALVAAQHRDPINVVFDPRTNMWESPSTRETY